MHKKLHTLYTRGQGTYHIVYWKVVLIIHVTGFQIEAYHINNPEGRPQCCQIEYGVYVIFHDKTAVKSNS